MKKYLMTGMAAVAFAAAFTSCSNAEDIYSEEEAQKISQQQIQMAYENAFIATFGQPDKNHQWGFDATWLKAGSRSANVEGNLWHKADYYNLEQDPLVTTAEKNLVFNYVNQKNNVKTVDQINFTEYWVSQIWNGAKDQNESGEQAPVTTSYPDQNGTTTTIIGGNQMDKLDILEKEGTWTHCNNFNSANNTDWTEGGEGGRTLMTESGTLSFRYIDSQGSHISEKYIIVPGSAIDNSLAGFYYVCFDFEKGYTDEEKAKETTYATIHVEYTDNNGNPSSRDLNWNHAGYYKDGDTLPFEVNNEPATLEEWVADQVGSSVSNVTAKLNVKGYQYGENHCDGDNNYTDWIVRISPAKVKPDSGYDVRIMVEDLSAKAADNGEFSQDSDWDFNDVVFDVKFTSETTCNIRIVCIGGVLPLTVAGQEVHALAGKDLQILGAVNLVMTGVSCDKSQKGKDIEVKVNKGTEEKPLWCDITANQGQAAAKFACPTTVDFCDERQDIRKRYPNFSNWILNEGDIFWK